MMNENTPIQIRLQKEVRQDRQDLRQYTQGMRIDYSD